MRHLGFRASDKYSFARGLLLGLISISVLLTLCPRQAAADGENIARDLANPFSDLWNIVNQINFNQLKGGLFQESHTQFNWNLQPVMPIPLNSMFNLVNRPVFPYYSNPYLDSISQVTSASGQGTFNLVDRFGIPFPDFTGEVVYASGLGDLELASVLVPSKGEGLIVGLGATFIFPTARDSKHIGQGLFQAGPAGGLFYVSKHFVCGVFPQHWHSVSGVDDEHPATRFTNLQYGISYLPTPKLTILSSANILIDWTKDEANRWTVPASIGVSYLFTFDKIPVSIGINYQWIVKHPADIPHQESIVRLTITPVIPSPFAKKE